MQIKSASPFDVKIIAVTEVCGFDVDAGLDLRINIIDQKEWDASNLSEKDLKSEKCDCCGHKIKYAVIAKHIPTNTIASLGRKCASNIEALKKCGSIIDGASIALSQRILCENREQEFRKAHPEACESLDWAKSGMNRVASDLLEKLRRFGSLSEKQISFLIGIHQRDISNRASATATAPTGKASVEGTILSVKEGETHDKYKTFRFKVLVDIGGGVKVWGSAKGEWNYHAILGRTPTGDAAEPQKGQRVKFTASFEPSQKDPLFGFFKRPSKWQVSEQTTS
jgi:hypothetical protein